MTNGCHPGLDPGSIFSPREALLSPRTRSGVHSSALAKRCCHPGLDPGSTLQPSRSAAVTPDSIRGPSSALAKRRCHPGLDPGSIFSPRELLLHTLQIQVTNTLVYEQVFFELEQFLATENEQVLHPKRSGAPNRPKLLNACWVRL